MEFDLSDFNSILEAKYRSLHIREKIRVTLKIFLTAFESYSPSELAFSFNGGKDCCIVLELFLIICAKPKWEKFRKILFLYWVTTDGFTEVTDFMKILADRHDLHVTEFRQSFREGLQTVADKGIKAVFMGQRYSDPYAVKSSFQMTDKDWPQLMRINPILHWDYADVWDFAETLNVDMCCLYDQGYTSLGSSKDTVPNPNLQQNDGTYLPAKFLLDGSKERDGRLKKARGT